MPAIVANAKRFLVNSDFPLDKIIWTRGDSFTVGGNSTGSQTIPHGLGFAPLPSGTWTTDASWALAYEFGSGPILGPSLSAVFTQEVSISADTTNVVLTCRNNSGGSVTVRYRAYCFAPSNIDPDVLGRIVTTNLLAFDSGYNYTKLYREGIANGTSTNIIHGLSYIPQTSIWTESGGSISPLTMASPALANTVARVDTSSLLITASSSSAKTHYKVYLDD